MLRQRVRSLASPMATNASLNRRVPCGDSSTAVMALSCLTLYSEVRYKMIDLAGFEPATIRVKAGRSAD